MDQRLPGVTSTDSAPGPDRLHRALDARDWCGLPDAHDVERIKGISDDPWSRRSPLHVTGSAIVIDPIHGRVLLRWHSRARMWLQVGGHADVGETDPLQVAAREAAEETGLTDLEVFPAGVGHPIQVVVVPVAANEKEPAHEHADIRYVLATSRPEQALPESPQAAIRWLDLEAAVNEVVEDSLRECLCRVRSLLDAGKSER
jgi:8-oxo-dGTP pyrophosphatase MutT (NUDIX family)